MEAFAGARQMQAQEENARSIRAQRLQQEQETEARRKALEQEARMKSGATEAMRTGGGVRSTVLASALQNAPDAVPMLTKFFDESDESAGKVKKLQNELNDARLNHLGHMADGALSAGGTADSVKIALSLYGEQFPDEAPQTAQMAQRLQQMAPEQIKGYLEQQRSAAPYWQERQQKSAERGPVSVAAGSTVIDPNTGKPIYTAPEKAEKPPIQKEYEYAVSQGFKGTLDQYQNVEANRHKSVNQITVGPAGGTEITADRPDAASGNKIDAATGYTPNSIFQNALVYGTEGRMPALGRSSGPQVNAARNAIQNKAAAIAAKAGVDLPTVQAEYRANSAALTKLLPQAQATANFANTAKDNIDLALNQSPQVTRTDSAWINSMANTFTKGATNAAGLSKFETYIYTAAREYAKVTSGGALSAQALSDSAAKEASKLLNAAQSPAAFRAVTQAMNDDMDNVMRRQSEGLKNVSGTIANFFAAANNVPIGAATGTPKVPTPNAGPTGPAALVWDPVSKTFKKPGGG